MRFGNAKKKHFSKNLFKKKNLFFQNTKTDKGFEGRIYKYFFQ